MLPDHSRYWSGWQSMQVSGTSSSSRVSEGPDEEPQAASTASASEDARPSSTYRLSPISKDGTAGTSEREHEVGSHHEPRGVAGKAVTRLHPDLEPVDLSDQPAAGLGEEVPIADRRRRARRGC